MPQSLDVLAHVRRLKLSMSSRPFVNTKLQTPQVKRGAISAENQCPSTTKALLSC